MGCSQPVHPPAGCGPPRTPGPGHEHTTEGRTRQHAHPPHTRTAYGGRGPRRRGRVLGQKWKRHHPPHPDHQPRRFGEPRTAIARISAKMRADRLRELLDAGLVTDDQPPPGHATCTRTPDGRALPPLKEPKEPRDERQSSPE
ncbi:winged helix-turn-helix transcriptional regulator [Streptomyces sp. NK08204]|uniref:winged helix-turn-helix transcriptional regulator n=1 Tax=Streptomyces sp. NK08204 TaxID=2873260 RepID=UPI001CED7383